MNFKTTKPLAAIFLLLGLAVCWQRQGQLPAQDDAPFPEMRVQRWQIPPTLLHLADGKMPDAENEQQVGASKPPIRNLQQIIAEEANIVFPEGTYLRYDPVLSIVEILHDLKSVRKVDSFLNALAPTPPVVQLRTEIIELATEDTLRVLRLSDDSTNHRDIREALQALIDKNVRGAKIAVSTMIEVAPGDRGEFVDFEEFQYGTYVEWSEEAKAVIPTGFETRNIGTDLQIDPILGIDGNTIEFNFSIEHHTSAPTFRPIEIALPDSGEIRKIGEMPVMHSKRIHTQLSMQPGSVRCLGAWRVTGRDADIGDETGLMQVVFVHAALHRPPVAIPIE